LETEWSEDSIHEAKRPAGDRAKGPAGVRGAIVAPKPGNAGGAKGSREMDDEWKHNQKNDQRQCAVRAVLNKLKRLRRDGDGSNWRCGRFAC
jgi:hypothetical protein